jgi:hypothetical protein
VASYRTGEVFGERSLVSLQPYKVSVAAKDDVTLVRLHFFCPHIDNSPLFFSFLSAFRQAVMGQSDFERLFEDHKSQLGQQAVKENKPL